MNFKEVFTNLWRSSGIAGFGGKGGGLAAIMIIIACFFLFLGIKKKFEPLLLVGIAFGMLLTNLPNSELFHQDLWSGKTVDYAKVLQQGGLLDILYIGVKTGIYPCLIFMGVGAMTDFGRTILWMRLPHIMAGKITPLR